MYGWAAVLLATVIVIVTGAEDGPYEAPNKSWSNSFIFLIIFESASKSPPKVGEVSSDTFDRPAPDAAVADIKLKLPLPSVDNNWLVSPSFAGKVKTTLPPKLGDTNST